MQEGLQEVIQFCDLMVTGRLEEILDGNKRAKSYPAVNLRHLLVLLRKYRQVTIPTTSPQHHTRHPLFCTHNFCRTSDFGLSVCTPARPFSKKVLLQGGIQQAGPWTWPHAWQAA